MASTSGAGTGKGAAEEPEPEPGESPYTTSTSAAAAPYDVREYQVHPDDRGGGGGGGKLTKKKKGGGSKKGAKDKGKGEGAEKEKDKEKGKEEDEEDDDGTHRCGNCDAPDAKSKCKGCGVEYYCNRECQTVRARMWRMGGAPPMHPSRRCSPVASSHTTTAATPTRSTGSTAATRRPAAPTSSRRPPRRSRTGCARGRSRPTSASSASSHRSSPPPCRAGTASALNVWWSCGRRACQRRVLYVERVCRRAGRSCSSWGTGCGRSSAGSRRGPITLGARYRRRSRARWTARS